MASCTSISPPRILWPRANHESLGRRRGTTVSRPHGSMFEPMPKFLLDAGNHLGQVMRLVVAVVNHDGGDDSVSIRRPPCPDGLARIPPLPVRAGPGLPHPWFAKNRCTRGRRRKTAAASGRK